MAGVASHVSTGARPAGTDEGVSARATASEKLSAPPRTRSSSPFMRAKAAARAVGLWDERSAASTGAWSKKGARRRTEATQALRDHAVEPSSRMAARAGRAAEPIARSSSAALAAAWAGAGGEPRATIQRTRTGVPRRSHAPPMRTASPIATPAWTRDDDGFKGASVLPRAGSGILAAPAGRATFDGRTPAAYRRGRGERRAPLPPPFHRRARRGRRAARPRPGRPLPRGEPIPHPAGGEGGLRHGERAGLPVGPHADARGRGRRPAGGGGAALRPAREHPPVDPLRGPLARGGEQAGRDVGPPGLRGAPGDDGQRAGLPVRGALP